MLLGFKLKAEFESARNIFTHAAEYASRPRQEREQADISTILDEWYARARRLEPLREDLVKITEASWEAEILMGEDLSKRISDTIEVYRRSYAELASAIYSHFETRRGEIRNAPFQNQEWLKGLHEIIYARNHDDFYKNIEGATNKLKEALKEYVK